MEFDDELGDTYFKNATAYIEQFPDIDVFLQLIVETNKEDKAVKITNQSVWSKNFVGENGELGFLNVRSLNEYTDFKINGALIKKSEYQAVGGLKKNIKMTFTYEFLLRMLNNTSKIFSLPKITYKHVIDREGSLFSTYAKTMSMAERKFWFETAKKEANFFSDRPIDTSSLKNEDKK